MGGQNLDKQWIGKGLAVLSDKDSWMFIYLLKLLSVVP